MKEFSVLMALVDFLPVALFAAASVILQRELHAKMSKGAFALFAAGTIESHLNHVSVRKNDLFFIEAGTPFTRSAPAA